MTLEELAELRELARHDAMLRRVKLTPASASSYAAGCAGKNAFDTFAHANASIAVYKRSEVRPYLCRFCGAYHLGGVDRQRRLAGKEIRRGPVDQRR